MKIKLFIENNSLRYTAISALCLIVLLLIASLVRIIDLVIGIIFLAIPVVTIPFLVYFFTKTNDFIKKENEKLQLARKRLLNKANYFESILQDSTDIIFTIDEDGFILKFNKGAENNFKFSQMEIVGKPFKILFINEADAQNIYDNVLRDGRVSNMELAMKTKNGEVLFGNLSLSEMKNENGKIIGLVATCKNITEKKKLEQELVEKNRLLEELAVTDSLTGLYNSRLFYENLQKELTRMKRQEGSKLSLMMIDIDSFKVYNDTYGHQAGDKVIRSLGKIIASSIRQDIDSGYRYGGDEFTVILPNTDRAHAQVVVDRIKQFYLSHEFEPTSLSIGIADTDQAVDKESIVKIADEEMYKHKKHRR